MSYDPRSYWPARFAAEGPTYVSKRGERDSFARQRRVFGTMLLQHLPRGMGKLLDFGCGVGRFGDLLAERTLDYVGADIVPGALELNRFGRTLLLADRIPEDGFDCVVAITVLQHIVDEDDFQHWCAEIGRVLVPGGLLVVIEDEGQPVMAPHMNPRGPHAIAEAVGVVFGTWTGLGEHWIGAAWKS